MDSDQYYVKDGGYYRGRGRKILTGPYANVPFGFRTVSDARLMNDGYQPTHGAKAPKHPPSGGSAGEYRPLASNEADKIEKCRCEYCHPRIRVPCGGRVVDAERN